MAGSRKVLFAIRPQLKEANIKIGINSFHKLLKINNMLVPQRKKYSCRTTKQDPSLKPSQNLVKDMVIDGPNQALCSDITYVYTDEGFLFLSLMMDMYVHDIVGWSINETLKTDGPLSALKMAIKTLPKDARLIAHSDRGCQYSSHAYRKLLETHGWSSSMTEELHCYENAMAERLNGILKHEYFLDMHFKTKADARKAIKTAIWTYNNRRLHEKCDYQTPKAFREAKMKTAA